MRERERERERERKEKGELPYLCESGVVGLFFTNKNNISIFNIRYTVHTHTVIIVAVLSLVSVTQH
jgi:hypothetical protein